VGQLVDPWSSSPGVPSSRLATVQVRWQKRRAKKELFELCYCMMDEFMVRGSKGPMQWMLDLWTYDLKMLTIEPAVSTSIGAMAMS
jgi:hypothetical protein